MVSVDEELTTGSQQSATADCRYLSRLSEYLIVMLTVGLGVRRILVSVYEELFIGPSTECNRRMSLSFKAIGKLGFDNRIATKLPPQWHW